MRVTICERATGEKTFKFGEKCRQRYRRSGLSQKSADDNTRDSAVHEVLPEKYDFSFFWTPVC